MEQQKEYDTAIALLGVATEAFARSEFIRRVSVSGTPAGGKLAGPWEKYKKKMGGLPGVLRGWAQGVPNLSPYVITTWEDQVWALRNLTFHEERSSPDEERFRCALDVSLALIFGIRPGAMLELAGVSP
jgi:hypothetical protein